MWVMAVKISQPNRPCTFVSMFCPHSCDLAQLTAEQMDIVMDWPKRTHVCMCTQEHTHAHSYSLLHHSPYERLFCRHPVSFALRCAALLSGHLALPLSDFAHFESSVFSVQCHLFTISTHGPWRTVAWAESDWNRRELCPEWKRAAASPKCTFQPRQRLEHTKIHTRTHASFYLTLYIISSSASLSHLWMLWLDL